MLDIVKKIMFKTSQSGESTIVGCDIGEFIDNKPTVLTNYWPNCSVYYRTIYNGDEKSSVCVWSESGDKYTKQFWVEGQCQKTETYKRGDENFIEPDKDLTIIEDYNKYLDKIPKEDSTSQPEIVNNKENCLGEETSIVIKNGKYIKYIKGINKRLIL